jgi:hypothetical protein
MILWMFYVTLLAYNILDVYQTNLLFGLGATEGNPILGLFMSNPHDIQTIIIIKIIMFTFLGIFVYIYNKQRINNENY